jgi:hypothetical protein
MNLNAFISPNNSMVHNRVIGRTAVVMYHQRVMGRMAKRLKAEQIVRVQGISIRQVRKLGVRRILGRNYGKIVRLKKVIKERTFSELCTIKNDIGVLHDALIRKYTLKGRFLSWLFDTYIKFFKRPKHKIINYG